MSLRRLVLAGIGLALVGATAWTAVPGSIPGYLLRQGYYQAELLWLRQPLDRAMASGRYTEAELARLESVGAMKAFGRTLGLSSTDNYDTISADWDRTIYNVSAVEELSFRPRTWTFPIVGRFPYLGFFRPEDARDQALTLSRQGYDVHVRTAGAYSTLGWFRDPLLPGMLRWSETALAGTLFHELAHATVWLPGSVQFNESFANFVGEVGALRYLEDRYGPDSEQVREVLAAREDQRRFRAMLHGVYGDLDAVYTDDTLTPGEKRIRKQVILASLPARTRALGLEREDRYLRAARGEWNNARLVQFRTYNRSAEWFAALLEQEGGDLPRFIARLEGLTADADDPYRALAGAVGAVAEAR